MIGDPDLVRIREKSSLIFLRKELEQDLSEERQVANYSKIARLDPTDIATKFKVNEITSRVNVERSRVARTQERQEREQQIRQQFSGWDGSHPAVVRAIKSQLKNPDSYKHVETRFNDTGSENFMVFTTFRGTNSFNAVVTNTATATVSPSGEVISLSVR